MAVQLKPFVTKVHDIWERCRKPLVVVNVLARLCRPRSSFIPKV